MRNQLTRRWWWFLLVMLTVGCASAPLDPIRLTPLDDAIVIELDVPDWREICVRQFPPEIQRYQCVTVGSLRASLERRLDANN